MKLTVNEFTLIVYFNYFQFLYISLKNLRAINLNAAYCNKLSNMKLSKKSLNN